MSHNFYHAIRKNPVWTILGIIIAVASATSAEAVSITVAWNPNQEPNIAGYRLHYGTASQNYTQHIDAGNSTSTVVSNLSTGITYYFAATAYNSSGAESAYSTQVVYTASATTPTPSPTAVPTATPSATPGGFVSIAGNLSACLGPLSLPVPNVTLSITGSSSGSILSDLLGNYHFSSLASGGHYTVTPSKSSVLPGISGISTIDVLATQRHYLNVSPFPPGCQRTAADVNVDGAITTADVVAIQRFYLGRTSGFANAGQFTFVPANRTYSGIVSNQVGQDFSAVILGDVLAPFVDLAGILAPIPAGDSRVAQVSLPDVEVDPSVTDFVVAVTTTTINPGDQLIGFQGDFTFDERVVTFQDPPVAQAGLTAGNWSVDGNVLPGDGPIRTLRISAYSVDLTPLSGAGTLFNLNMTRVDGAPGANTSLDWSQTATGSSFVFINGDLNMQAPRSTPPGDVTVESTP
jgi:hypothetical protein